MYAWLFTLLDVNSCTFDFVILLTLRADVELCFSLSNLFYGLDERSPLRADLYVSMVKLAQQADLVPQLAINIEQVHITCM